LCHKLKKYERSFCLGGSLGEGDLSFGEPQVRLPRNVIKRQVFNETVAIIQATFNLSVPNPWHC